MAARRRTTRSTSRARQLGRRIGGALGDEVGQNLQRIFAYGVRNSFGMTFDPKKGDLWTTENGGRAFDEVNRVERGFNGGWIQFMGPLERVAEFKAIEIGVGVGANGPNGLQQVRFPPANIADTPEDAKARLFHVPGVAPARPGVQLEAGRAAGGARLHPRHGAGRAVPTAT